MAADKVFFGGIPTGGDVRLLVQTLGVPNAGDEFTHEQVEAALSIQRSESRYLSVTKAWRDQMRRDHNIDLAAVPGVGFRALLPDERISAGVKGVQSGIRKQLRSIRRADSVRTDDPALLAKQTLMRRYGVALAAEANKLAQQLEPPKPQDQQPRRIPGDEPSN